MSYEHLSPEESHYIEIERKVGTATPPYTLQYARPSFAEMEEAFG
ncbi:MAG: hypothetical protein ABFS45_20620 [Pseudomonadota bacterium]